MSGRSGDRDSNNDAKFDIFIANSIYPDAASVFAWRPEPIEEVKDECLVVLDTNVLLVPYTINPKNLDQIGDTYRSLVDQGRLIVPGQVAREFARLRANKLAELQQQLADKKSRASRLQTGKYPLLESASEYQQALRVEEEVNRLLTEYKETLDQVMGRIQRWTWSDPVSLLYGDLFNGDVVTDPELDREEVRKDLVWRQTHKVPPGYKDASKEDKGVGDLLIWRTILKAGEDRGKSVVFVTGEEKSDWWHRSGSGALYPRYELVEEFRRHSSGHSFHVLSFSNFLDLYGVSRAVVDEVRQEESALLDEIYYSGNAVGLPDGNILVVRHSGRYGAVKALQQTGTDRGASIRYQWWYQPNGSGSFSDTSVQSGYGETREDYPGPSPQLEVGPIELEWSVSGEGYGYVYFGPPGRHSQEYELALTYEADITRIRGTQLNFFRRQVVNG